MVHDCDVLVVGGGPTGVTLALLLAKRGVRTIVAEKDSDIYPLPRAAHVDHEVRAQQGFDWDCGCGLTLRSRLACRAIW